MALIIFGRAAALTALLAAAAPAPEASANEALEQLQDHGGATTDAPEIHAAGIDLPPWADGFEDIPERLCYEVTQRYYFPNGDLVRFVNELYRKFLDPIEGRCDLKQPLFNLQQLAPQVYRSAKPTPAGFDQLKVMGVKTVLFLAADQPHQGTTEAQMLAAKGLNYENIPIDYTTWPTNEELDRALAILTDPSKLPVDFHCTCGYDRTGIVAAAYRVVVQGWPVQKAVDEAKSLGWHFPLCGDLVDFINGYVQHRSSIPPNEAGRR